MKLNQILVAYDRLKKEIKDLENSLSDILDHPDWEKEAAKDKRYSVQVLYAELCRKREVIVLLNESEITADIFVSKLIHE